jgi:hypothetical protein
VKRDRVQLVALGSGLLMAGLALSSVFARQGAGQAVSTAPPARDPLLSVLDADPLELADLVARLGDDAIGQRLGPQVDPALRLAAIRACAFLQAPELALPVLAQIAGGRDPDLAPAAARRALGIVQRLALDGLQRRELMPVSLAPARAALAQVAASVLVRADLRALAAQAAHLLGSLGVPGPKA